MTFPTYFKDKNILITGGTGSFGRAFAKKLITETECNKVIILSRDEWKQWEMKQSAPYFSDPRMRYFLGDVRDLSRLTRAFNEVDIVVHAAALKQVPAAEYNPTEFIKTNIQGAINVIDAAIAAGVSKVIALSTDKAVNPVNLYGATKLCSDKLFIAGNSYVGATGKPTFSVVRYGNVVGSRGSVIPYWASIIKEGLSSLPVTDLRMTRFWVTLEEAVDFVIHSIIISTGGEIFVPKIPSMKITDLAEAMKPGIKCHEIGVREGEKIHELMITTDDAHHTLEYDSCYIIIPEFVAHNEKLLDKFKKHHGGTLVPAGFSYTSNNNTHWLAPKELHEKIKHLL